MVRHVLESIGQFAASALLLLAVNSIHVIFAANLDTDYRDAVALFEKRDVVSRGNAMSLLEKNLQQKADHLESQALISYIYAHEAYVLAQIGEPASEYQNSATAFSKAVLAQQPQNLFARKTNLVLLMMAGNMIDARKTLEATVTDNETDADMWYLLALVSEGEKANKAIAKALTLNPDHVWIHSDMAFRALKMGEIAVAEKWAKALEAQRPGVPESDLLNAAIAAAKKDKKRAKESWGKFIRKAPDSSLANKIAASAKKNSP